MKYKTVILILCVLFTFAGCSTSQVAIPVEATIVPPAKTSTATLAPTQSHTPAPTLTLMPSATAFVSPTATPKNFVLAEKGYDIADVRYFYQREDILRVSFKYRLDESRTSKDTYIFMTIPPKCRGNDYQYFPPNYVAKDLTGEGQFTYKMTLQGVCDTDSIEFTFYPVLENPHPPFLYSESVLQPYHLVRSFPTLNSDTITLQNFQFTPQANWSGVFTFDYAISEEIPLSLERYSIVLWSFGPDGGCSSYSEGPLITEQKGTYQIPVYLPQQLLYPYKNCLNGLEKYTYTRSGLSVGDILGGTDVYYQEVNLPYKVWKSP